MIDNLFDSFEDPLPRKRTIIKTTHRHLNAARAVAMSSEGVGRRNCYKVGAILYSGKKILAARTNSYKESSVLLKYTKFPCRHAETACILSYGLDNCAGLDMMCARVLANGDLTMAKPCQICEAVINDVGLRRVYYTNWNGEVEKL